MKAQMFRKDKEQSEIVRCISFGGEEDFLSKKPKAESIKGEIGLCEK